MQKLETQDYRAGLLSGLVPTISPAIVYPLGWLYCAFKATLDKCEVQPPLQDSFRTVSLKQTLRAMAIFFTEDR
ncbi:MAG: hypothetical protein QOH35_4816 [Acidobacteriaceae bacterium]|jgi:hypothetical protein|nr:hypothetical protein [Acidobacteriaceae bacterium]